MDEIAKKMPAPDSTSMAAGAIGINMPTQKEINVDPNTGEKKIPAMTNPDGSPKSAGETFDTQGNKVEVDSLGNVIAPVTELTKEELLAKKTDALLKERKAEALAAIKNKEIDEKIDELKLKRFHMGIAPKARADLKVSNAADQIQ